MLSNKNRGRVIGAYLRYRLKILVLFLLFAGIFAVILALSRLPIAAVGYAFSLCLFLGILAAAVDFTEFYKTHRQLSEMCGRILYSKDGLPPPRSALEQDYARLIDLLYAENLKTASASKNALNDMTDYYTMWVHQIKTPISAMHLLLQSDKSAHNEELELELFNIERYVEMVLSYLRINSPSSDLMLKKYDLNKIVNQAVRKYSRPFIHKKIKLALKPFEKTVLTDEKWLTFVIEQLLSNALKYTNKGTISIDLDAAGRLVIQDTGIGIAPEDIPRVFEKGFTGYNGRFDKKSSGIGLYLCKKIMTRLSHTIEISSAVGKGTTVTLGFDMVDLNN